ncbi:MAG: prolyl oligopeptidase family serine peptidase [Chitinophagaceae bacterium]
MNKRIPFLFLMGILNTIMITSTLEMQAQRLLKPKDVYSIKNVANPKISPDGKWVLYSVSKADSTKDKYNSKLYMTSWDGTETVALTEQTQGPGSAEWTPDNKYISFLASGKDESGTQLFIMDRRGGEPVQLTNFNKAEITGYAWNPNAKSIVFSINDPNYADTAKSGKRKPYEMNRYHFKQDYAGYLDNRKTHLYHFDVSTKKLDTLTTGTKNETNPVFSNDGSKIAYISNITEDPDKNSNTDIFLLDLKTKAKKQITTYGAANTKPDFSPNDQYISYLQKTTEDAFDMYDHFQLCTTDINTGKTEILTSAIDRGVNDYCWSTDANNLFFILEDDREEHVYSLNTQNKQIIKISNGQMVYSNLEKNAKGQMVLLRSTPNAPKEIFAFENSSFRPITAVNKDFINEIKPIQVKGFTSISKDGTKVSGLLYAQDTTAKNLPLILFIHGGPVAQDDYGFDMSRQVLASAGFAVAAVNYRGSSGRGIAFCKAIYADWGNKEVVDIMGAADYLIKSGIADPNRMGIGGWSYGGILTNYTIARDPRMKAAASGAGSSLQLTMFGTDQYVNQYERELGAPWKNLKKWMDLSYPFFQVEKIKTPTLFMASEDDFNVPVAGAEQMYQAFKSVGIPAELIIYPKQNHGINVPSYVIHRYEKYIDWFSKYLK